MKKVNTDHSSSPAPIPGEERWMKKRKALMERLATGMSAPKIDREDLAKKKKECLLHVEGLEEENHKMAKSVKEFELQTSKKTEIYRLKRTGGDDLQRQLLRLGIREHSLLNEAELYESEHTRLAGIYTEISEKLKNNITFLEEVIDRITFTKGEVHTLSEKMASMEGDIPVKSRELDNMDETIKTSIRALGGFVNRARSIERDLKINYYEKKEQSRG